MGRKGAVWDDGLGKQCSKHEDWTRCSCPWWGKYKRIRRSLAKWARTRITNKQQAREILHRMKTEIDRTGTTGRHEGVGASAPMTVAQFLAVYQEKYLDVQDLSDKALATAMERAKKYFGVLPLSALTSAGPIEDWIADMKKEKLSPRSQKAYASRLRHALNWAKARKLIPETGFDSKMIHFEKDASRRRVLQPGEEARLLEACDRMNTKQHRMAGAMMKGRLICALDTGLRQGTMLRLQNKMIDFDQWIIHVPAEIAKDDEPLELPVESPRLRQFLKTRRILGPEAYPFGHGAGNPRYPNGSFQADIRKPVTAMFKLAGIAFGRADLVWHDFRHDVATMLTSDLNVPLPVAKEITGHAETRMLERYVNPQLDTRRAALKRLADERERRLKEEQEQGAQNGAQEVKSA
jgi:integrase